MKQKVAVIIGAGPAGLTAAYELLEKTDIKPVIFETTKDVGGISKTVTYKGNRMDIGGHRFYSKSRKVVDWWLNILPLQGKPSSDDILLKREVMGSATPDGPDPELTDKVMLLRRRLSRMFFLHTFFDYPLSIKWKNVKVLGMRRMVKMAASYARVKLFPIRKENSLEDFLINRFGRELYFLFFKDYTEKVWGVPCSRINPEWGAQRIKGLTVTKTIRHALKTALSKDRSLEQKDVETSLIEQFLYPKLGAGQLWEEVAERVCHRGGEIQTERRVVGLSVSKGVVTAVTVEDRTTHTLARYECDYVFSTMPVKELIGALSPPPPSRVRQVADGLVYRDFLTVGVLLNKVKMTADERSSLASGGIPDNWIYIQERDMKLGRIQIFNNWSPYMVKDPETIWIGLEYFCNENDGLWSLADDVLSRFAIDELIQIGMVDKESVLDTTIVRMKKAYPAYFGSYDDFHIIRGFTDAIENLFLVGRNGMHRYNNMDHSMLTAMSAVDNILNDVRSKENIWLVNTGEESASGQ